MFQIISSEVNIFHMGNMLPLEKHLLRVKRHLITTFSMQLHKHRIYLNDTPLNLYFSRDQVFATYILLKLVIGLVVMY